MKKLLILILMIIGLNFSVSANAKTNIFGVDIENHNINACINIKTDNAEKQDDKICLKEDANVSPGGIKIDKKMEDADTKKFYTV
ncbi:MAG: hypothetical protein GWO07_06650 [Candidatus Dadabacteria bacterium]|nr:hypothetical protein [Candidatus Dadabacteria bacterium]NIS08431.1 hypothetical protein [Candidatus Dadabacteria bacterium]NIV41996.1 hypothetical protein [Candidatus Dadabacteria bacterium]NIY21919.1 hypothetical protein [Candidatus Dadabacteria bacterium]